jgi:hypothetical protein
MQLTASAKQGRLLVDVFSAGVAWAAAMKQIVVSREHVITPPPNAGISQTHCESMSHFDSRYNGCLVFGASRATRENYHARFLGCLS